MKIVQLQTSMKSAGMAALRLHNSFLEKNIHSTIITLNPDTILDENLVYLTAKSKTLLRINYKLEEYLKRNAKEELGTFSYPVLGTNVSKMAELQNADVIYLHWILGGFLNFSNLDNIFKLNKPVIIFMHDMWWITGGCHHSFSCEKYKLHCNNCPIFKSDKEKGLSFKEFKKKKRLYEKYDNLYFVSPSKWLFNCAKESALTKTKPIFYIPNILGTSIYKPFERNTARNILNLPQNEVFISFGADSLNSPYKGWIYLKKALGILKEKGLNISVLIFGKGSKKKIESELPFKTYFTGYLNDEYSLSLVYNAANVFIIPSIADNQPTVVIESLSCGTPVVGFKVGGIPDMIAHKENGYLANYKDFEDLARGIEYCIQNKVEGKILSAFHKKNVINQHLELIEIALNANKVPVIQKQKWIY